MKSIYCVQCCTVNSKNVQSLVHKQMTSLSAKHLPTLVCMSVITPDIEFMAATIRLRFMSLVVHNKAYTVDSTAITHTDTQITSISQTVIQSVGVNRCRDKNFNRSP